MKDIEVVVADALERLREAVDLLYAETEPKTPMPRMRKWQRRIGDRVFSYGDDFYRITHDHPSVESIYLRNSNIRNSSAPARVVKMLGAKPSSVLSFVRWVEEIERWMRARAAGRQRHAQEILRQQQRAIEELQVRATAARLKMQ